MRSGSEKLNALSGQGDLAGRLPNLSLERRAAANRPSEPLCTHKYPFVLMPSSVSHHSWNLLVNPTLAKGLYELVLQERFRLDGRLNPICWCS
jgi:RES domain-containing protein